MHTLNNDDVFVEIDENENIPQGVGYTMKGIEDGEVDTNYNFIGTANNGDINVAIEANKFLLTGNPYPSTISANAFNNLNNSVTEGVIYLWDQPQGNEHFPGETDNSGGYATITNGVTVAAATLEDEVTPVVGATTPTLFIKPGQGFIVYGTNTGNVSFTNALRDGITYDGSRHFFKTKKLQTLRSIVRLGFEYEKEEGKVYHRQIVTVLENEEQTNVVEDEVVEDDDNILKKKIGKDAFMFDYFENDAYWVIPNEEDRFVITASPAVSDDLELPIGVVVDKQREVTFKIDAAEAIFGDIYLYDKETSSITNIKDKSYKTMVESGDYRDRFSLIFSGEETGVSLDTDEVIKNDPKRIINVSNNQIKVILEAGVVDKIQLYNLNGQLIIDYVESKKTNNSTVSFDVLNSNIYVVKIITDTKTITQKVVVK